MVEARPGLNKFLSKDRWKAKVFSKDEPAPKKSPELQVNQDDDVNDFLKPSTDKAQARKEAAAAAFAKPRIDVAKAQRWPGAGDTLRNAEGRSPGIGGLKTGTRKKGLTVSFVRTLPDVIGEGGDECEEPSIEVCKRKKSNSASDVDSLSASIHQDDMNVGIRTPTFHGEDSANKEAERRGIVTRTMTSHGEMSPPLQKKMEMGSINSHAVSPSLPPRGMGPMGLGERPKALQRAPTGFDSYEGRPSMDSTYSYQSENAGPELPRRMPSSASATTSIPEEEEDFTPRALSRSQTGWSEHLADSNEERPPLPTPGLPRQLELNLRDDESPLESSVNAFLQSDPTDQNSYSARVIHSMRADEGRAFHEAARRPEALRRDSGSSADSFRPGSGQSGAFQIGTPPQQFQQFAAPFAERTPPRIPFREPYAPPAPQQAALDTEDPYRSRARGPSPGRSPMPPGTLPLDTDRRPPSSSSSQYTMPSAASRTRGSPLKPADQFSATSTQSIQRLPSQNEKTPHSATSQYSKSSHEPISAVSQSSILPTPPGFEKPEYIEPPQEPAPPVPPAPPAPSQWQGPVLPISPPRRQTVNEAPPIVSQEPGPTALIGRSDTKSQAELAFTDFSHRVTHMQGIFALTAQLSGRVYDHTPMQWLRVAIWWFLRGRAGMETLIRSRPADGEPQSERLQQPHVDLAKTWWIITEVVQHHPSLRRYGDQRLELQARFAREAGDFASADAYDVHDIVLSSLKMLLGSMKRHQSMPPNQALIQGQDQSIWVEYPRFAPDAQSVLSGKVSKAILANGGQDQLNPAMLIPLGDTKTEFCYFRMFVNASVSTDDLDTDRVQFPAVISVLRPREEYKVKLSICSQTELLNVTVGSNPDTGPTWRDIAWKAKSCGINVQLRHGFNLNVELTEQDFRSLWNIVDHTNRVESNLRQRGDERLSARFTLRDFSYKDTSNKGVFPQERVPGCKLYVFEKFERSTEGTGKRVLHRGYRLVVVTNTKNRTLSCVHNETGTNQQPLNFEYMNDPADKAPGMILRFREETPDKKQKLCTMSMTFNDPKERNHLFGIFTSMNQSENEAVFAQVPLKSFSIESADPAEGFSQSGHDVLKRLQWLEAKALNQDPEAVGLESAPTVMSESLRIVCRHTAGIVSDRMNLGPGELLVRLPIDGAAELTLLRNPQLDMAVAIDASRIDKDIPDALAELLRTLTNASTIRRLTFSSFNDLHVFQLAVTGFQVKFDGIASTFSISRRRMVVPIYKQWTASTIRLQIVVQDSIVQLLAFFEDFSHADAMNFQLKSMDVFEKTEKGGKPCVRLVDAKFALPVEERRGEGKMGKEEGRLNGWAGMRRRFVCLDQVEYPGEHDDILISFDNPETRDRFAEALPATTEVGRKFTMRRKI